MEKNWGDTPSATLSNFHKKNLVSFKQISKQANLINDPLTLLLMKIHSSQGITALAKLVFLAVHLENFLGIFFCIWFVLVYISMKVS